MEEERARKKLLILYATQTRNALDVAERVGREAERRGCPVHLLSLEQYDARCLAQEGTVIFVVSTTGQGDTPNPMKGFWKDLLQKNLTRQWLEGLGYAVLKLDLNHMALQIERAHRASPLKFSLDRPDCILKLVKNEPLTKSGCKDKEPIPYEVGDVLEVLPSQNPAAVDAFILRCNLDPESFITMQARGIAVTWEGYRSLLVCHGIAGKFGREAALQGKTVSAKKYLATEVGFRPLRYTRHGSWQTRK